MTAAISLRRPAKVQWDLRPPGSKSLTNRALLLAAIAEGRSEIRGWLDADDTRYMRDALAKLGVSVTEEDGALVVPGAGGPLRADSEDPEVFVGTAGTVARFLLAVLAASPDRVVMDGTPRMRERPMSTLIDALVEQGAAIRSLGQPGFLPVEIGPHPQGLRGGEIRIGRPASSQFISGLVIAAALASDPTRIVLEQGTPARPYVDMTLAVVEAFGGRAAWADTDCIEVVPTPLCGRPYDVEPDASAASYPLALAAIWGGTTVIDGLGTESLQGDVAFAQTLAQMGARVQQGPQRTELHGTGELRGGDFDLSNTPDMTLTLAVAALFARSPTTIRGVAILRHHESDRLAAAATELRKLGAEVEENEDGLRIVPPAAGPRSGVEINTYDDHRMAMAFAMVGDVVILDPDCVGKTYPEYFRHLERLGMVVGAE
jgi:3-phosphoshikimate 1-carboxyvinyltransferase